MKNAIQSAESRLKFKFPYELQEWIDKGFVIENYHKHTTWSNLVQIDSATSIEDFIKKIDEYGGQCYFSTEHGYPGEWLYCYDICKKTEDEDYRRKHELNKSIKFRYGAEVYWVKDIHSKEPDKTNCHMILIARNYTGIRKLNYIISIAHDEGFYYKPRIDLNLLFTLNPEDVYVTSACVAGFKYDDAFDVWVKIWKHFKDSFLFEYQTHNTEKQIELNKKIFQISQKYGIQTIIGLDTHYVSPDDCTKRDNLLARKGLVYEDENGWYMDYPSGVEVFERLKAQNSIPDEEIYYAMMNTHLFLSGCNELEYDKGFKIPVLPKYKDYSYKDRCKILQGLLNKGYLLEDENHKSKERIDAIRYEYGEIKDSECADYFIDNYELIRKAIDEYGGELTTTSRGSASSYYCSKLLGFTTIDRFESEVPIIPERFITKDRILKSHQMPDIDYNCAHQEPFVKAAKDLFGEHGCYPLLAVGKFGEKSGFKMFADVMGIEPSVANDITKSIDDFNEAQKSVDEDERDSIKIEEYILNPEHLKIFEDSKPYQGIVELAKCHACGFTIFNGNPRQSDVVGYGDIRYEIGLIRCQSGSGNVSIVANVEGNLLDNYGYVKDDFLIVDVVGIINKLYKSIGMDVPPVSKLRKMVDGDKPTWDLYAKGYTCCLNQCEKPGTTKKVMQYKPQNVKELAAFIAGIRPGFKSLINGFIKRIAYSTGEKAIDELLKDSFNYMLYQEAIMNIFTFLGIPMAESYDTIKKISKKKLVGEALEKVENILKNNWLKNIGNLDNFEKVYKVIKDSSHYSFNAPHAGSMAFDSLYEAWFKAHHTSKFYEVTLNHYQQKGDKNKVSDLQKEAVKCFGYKIAPYGYGQDNSHFTVDDENKIIYSSLDSIKGIGAKAVKDLYSIYQKGTNDFVDVYISTFGTKVNGTVFRNLIKIGYFNQFGTIKKLLSMVDIIDDWKSSTGVKKTFSKSKIEDLIINESEFRKFATDVSEKTGKVSAKQYRITDWIGLMKAFFIALPDEEISLAEQIKYQYEILGHILYFNDNLNSKYIAITNLNTKYSPKFEAYCLKNGSTLTMKVHNVVYPKDKERWTSFKDNPFEDGDVLLIESWSKKNKRRKTSDGKWEEVIDGEPDIWLDKYSIIKNL